MTRLNFNSNQNILTLINLYFFIKKYKAKVYKKVWLYIK